MNWKDVHMILRLAEVPIEGDAQLFCEDILERMKLGRRRLTHEEMDEVEAMKRTAEEVWDLEFFDTKSRDHDTVMAHVGVARQLLRKGWSHADVGKAVKKNHATVTHYKNIIDSMDAFPSQWDQELEKMKEFDEMINCMAI